MDFLRNYIKLNENTEIPGLFAVWVGLSCLSAVLGRRTWIDMGTYTIFPNLFVLLVAGSGKCRKSTAISIGENLLYAIEPPLNIISQKTTPQALIEALQRQNLSSEGELLSQVCEGYVVADEMNTFLNKNTYDELGSLLIQFYDCKKNFSYHTKGRGVERLEDTCMGLIAGSTIDYIKQGIPVEAVGGGLTSRLNFIFVPQPTPPVPRTFYTDECKKIKTELIQYLQRLLTCQGPFHLDQQAWAAYEKEYIRFYNESPLYADAATSGYASRRGVHTLKLAMLFSISEDPQLVVRSQHIEKAVSMLQVSEEFLPMLMSIITANETGLLLETILSTIKQYKSLERADLLRRVSNRVDAKRLTDLMSTLIQSGQVTAYTMGSKIYYEMAR